MQITAGVNQREAIRLGFNCNSTVKLDVDISTLTEAQRQCLATWFDDGELKIGYTKAQINKPTIEGLVEFLNDKVAKAIKAEEEEQADKAKKEQEVIEFRKAFDADPEGHTEWGSNYGCGVRNKPYHSGHDHNDLAYWLTPEQIVIAKAICDQLKAKVEAKEMATKQQQAAAEAARQATSARRKAQLNAFVASVGGTLAERHAEGFTTELEIHELFCNADLQQRGLTCRGGNKDWLREESEAWEGSLTDEQFAAYKAFKAKLPADASLSVVEMWNKQRNEYNDPIKRTKTDRILVAEASYEVGEIKVNADLEIGTLPDIDPEED